MSEGASPAPRHGLAVPFFAAVGLLDCVVRWAVGRAALPPLLRGLVSPGGLGLFLAAGVWFTLALLVDAAVRLRTGLTPRTARAILFLLSVPFVALVARSGWSAYRAGVPFSLTFAILAASALAILVACTASETVPLTRLPSAALADARLMLRNRRGQTLIVLAALAVGVPAVGLGRARWRETKARTEYVAWFEAQSRIASPALREDGVVVVVKFSDYQCPPCRVSFEQYGPVIRRLTSGNPRLIKLVTLDFPLDPSCNENVHAPIHPVACEAAAAVRLARRQGGGAEALERWLFAHQRELSHDNVWEAAARLGSVRVSPDAYAAALDAIRDEVRLGTSLAVDSTPTFFVNGVRISGVVPPDRFEAVLREEIRRLALARS